MRSRLLFATATAAVVATAGTVLVPATAAPAIVTPTTTTTPRLVIVTPTTATTTTLTTTTTTTAPVIAAPATAPTTPPEIVAPTVPATTPQVVVAATTATTTAPVIAAATTSTVAPLDADTPLGAIDTSGAVPDGLDLSAFPDTPQADGPVAGDGPQIAAGFSCAYQCIKSGVAYPRGFGALLVVETHVPARLFVSVVDDNNDAVGHTNSTGMVTELSWSLDDLEPGQTYYAIVAATDENDDTAYAYGEFTTLSERTIEITIGSPTITGGPTNVTGTFASLKTADLNFRRVSPPESLTYYSLPTQLDLELNVFRQWETEHVFACDGFDPDVWPPQGDSDAMCASWNTAFLDLDLNAAGADRWTSLTIEETFQTSSGDGPLPAGHGDPRFFHFSAPVTVTVTYG